MRAQPPIPQRAKAPGRSQMLTPSGMLKLRFRLGTNFWPLNRLDICHRLPQWFLRSFNLFRSGFHSFHSGFRWRQCKQLQAVAAGIAGDCRGRRAGHMGNGCCWWLLTLRQAAATEWRPVSPVRLPRCTMTHHYAP